MGCGWPLLRSERASTASTSSRLPGTAPVGEFPGRRLRRHRPADTASRNICAKRTEQSDAAEIALTRLQGQVDEDRHPKADITVGRAIEQWLEVATLEDTTRERYDDLIRIYITPTFGSMPAAKLDAELLERFYARLQRCRALCSGRSAGGHTCRPLSSSTVRKIHFIISGALERAVRWRHLGVQQGGPGGRPVREADRPRPAVRKRGGRPAVGRVERRSRVGLAPVADDGDRIAARRDERAAVEARRHGPRRAVRRAEQRAAEGRREGEGDQDSSAPPRRARFSDGGIARRAPLPAGRAICSARLQGRAMRRSCSRQRPTDHFRGRPRSLTLRFYRLAKKLGLRSTRLHSLRHYSATELIAAGVDIRTVAGRLGHGSGGATTLKIYAGWVDEAGHRAAATMGTIMPSIVLAPRARTRSVRGHRRDAARPDRGWATRGRGRIADDG